MTPNPQTPLSRAISGAAMAPLSREQIRELVILARKAWKVACETCGTSHVPPPTSHVPPPTFDEFRRRETLLVVERPGLRQCRQEDFLHLKAHWLRALGAVRQAERVQARATIEPRQMALHKLHAELANASDVIKRPREYVAKIAAARFKTSLIETDLAANQVWNLVFDIRRAAQRRRAQGARDPRPQTIDPRPQTDKILQFPGAMPSAPCAMLSGTMRHAPCTLQTDCKEAP